MGGGRQLDVDAHALHLAPHRPLGYNHKYHTVDVTFLLFAQRLHGHMLNVNAFALQHIPYTRVKLELSLEPSMLTLLGSRTCAPL